MSVKFMLGFILEKVKSLVGLLRLYGHKVLIENTNAAVFSYVYFESLTSAISRRHLEWNVSKWKQDRHAFLVEREKNNQVRTTTSQE